MQKQQDSSSTVEFFEPNWRSLQLNSTVTIPWRKQLRNLCADSSSSIAPTQQIAIKTPQWSLDLGMDHIV
jgi:hypothetical protein